MEDKMGVIYRQYELKIFDTYRVKGCTVLDTDDGEWIIKPYESSETKAKIDNMIKKHMKDCGYEKVDEIRENKEGNLISYNQYGNPFVVRRMLKGQECDLYNENQVLEATTALARLHDTLKQMRLDDELEKKIRVKNLFEEMDSHLKGMKRIKRYLIEKNKKNYFESEFLNMFDRYIEQGENSKLMVNELKKTGVELERDLYHGSFDHHSVLFLENDNSVAVTNFEKCAIGSQIVDFYHFLRKTMEKNDWNERLGNEMIMEYTSNGRVSDFEWETLRILLEFPEKFWKIANQYYNKRKVWVSDKSIQKLNSLNEQEEKRKMFIKTVIKCHIE